MMNNAEMVITNEKPAYLCKGDAGLKSNSQLIENNNIINDEVNKIFNKNQVDLLINKDQAEKLLGSFQCCFLKHGSKAPEGEGWQNKPRTISEWTSTTGIGIICGQIPNSDYSIHALDFDTYTPDMAEAMRDRVLAMLGGKTGKTLIRVGLPPKFLIPFKSKSELRKQTTKIFWTDPADDKSQKNQLEILGKGNQFVAYQIHPETLKPYLWTDEAKSTANLFDVSLEDLIEFEQEDIEQIKAEFEKTAVELNLEQSEKDKAAAAAPVRTYNHKNISPSLGGIREKIVAYYDLHGVLTRNGYTFKGRNSYLYAGNSTGIPGVKILPNNGTEAERIYSHHSDDPLADGHSHDVASVLCILEYDGDFSAMIKQQAPIVDPEGQKQRQAEFRKQKTGKTTKPDITISDDAKKIADKINYILLKKLEVADDDIERIERLAVDAEIIDRMINSSCWSGIKSKLFLLGRDENLNQYTLADAYKFLTKAHGNPINKEVVEDAAAVFFKDNENIKKSERQEFISDCLSIPRVEVIDYLKERQRESFEWRVDMFANQPRMERLEDKTRIVLTHKPFVGGKYDIKIIDDFKQHFHRFDEFIDFINNARFVKDRKKAYLWIHADSDWGKGFLLGILRQLNMAVELSMKEIEGIFEGKPSGRSPVDFKRSFVLAIDEFKSVKSELKQLLSEISLAPKNQLTSTVEIFAKIFLSAENVGSLVTSQGVENQFANRMSVFRERGNLTARPLYVEKGNSAYFESVKNYMAEKINLAVAAFQSMGRTQAEKESEKWLNAFIKRNGIDTLYDRMSDTLPELANDFIRWCQPEAYKVNRDFVFNGGDGFLYLKSFSKIFGEFLTANYDQSEIKSFNYKRSEIPILISEDGKGIFNHRFGRVQIKSIKLKNIKN